MNQRPRFQALLDRLKQLWPGHEPPPPPNRRGRPRRVSRREREAHRKRQLYISLAVIGVIVIGVLVGGSLYDYVLKPDKVLASVDGTKIRRKDYWKVRSYDLINEANFYNQYASLVQGDQQQQYLQLAQQAQSELGGVWGSTDVDAATLNQMVEDQIYLHGMGSLGLKLTNQDIQNYIYQTFGSSQTPIFTPTPAPTLIPQRAAWATETAQAAAASPSASPVASPSSSPAAVAAASPAATPGASPGASPAASPAVTPTPNIPAVKATAEANYQSYKDSIFGQAHLSQSDFDRLIAKPAVARQMVTDKLNATVGQTADQVHAAHILVGTKDLADKIYQEATKPGANFAQLAKNQSTDTLTAPNGGDLGWFTRGEVDTAMADVAFSLKPGQVSQPFKTPYGWDVMKVYAHDQHRAMTDNQISNQQQLVVQQWVAQQKKKMSVHASVTPAPTPTSTQFQPPAGAPTPPPSPTPIASPAASPGASPAAGTPVASPAGR